MESIKQKLSSRKLWAAVAAAVITILTAIFKDDITSETAALIGQGVIALCCYIFGEGIVDAARLIWSEVIKKTPDAQDNISDTGAENSTVKANVKETVTIPSGATDSEIGELLRGAVEASDGGDIVIKLE